LLHSPAKFNVHPLFPVEKYLHQKIAAPFSLDDNSTCTMWSKINSSFCTVRQQALQQLPGSPH
jgi:hypothetical protein